MKRLLFLALVALTACSGGSPTAVSTSPPSTILLPAQPASDATTMFIGHLSGSPINQGNTWVAVVEVTILDQERAPVAGVRIAAEWDEGDEDSTACTTDENGACELESGSIRKRVSQTVLEITDVSHDELTYAPEFDDVADPEARPRELTIRKP